MIILLFSTTVFLKAGTVDVVYVVEKDAVDIIEQRSCAFLTEFQKGAYSWRKNNGDKHAVPDLVGTSDAGSLFIDVQYSTKFSTYGDLRVDAISAAKFKVPNVDRTAVQKVLYGCKTVESFELNYDKYIDVIKPGKVFDPVNKDMWLLYWVFNTELADYNVVTGQPDKLVLVKAAALKSYVDRFKNEIVSQKRFKLNDKVKNSIYENHVSAFYAVNYQALLNTYKNTKEMWAIQNPAVPAYSRSLNTLLPISTTLKKGFEK